MASKHDVIRPHVVFDENACVVCFKPCLIYSIGSCNHAVCYECSSRMRCLCLQNECPICRQDLPKVIFTKSVAPFAQLDRELRSGLYEKKYRIVFADLEIQKAFYRLLENRCSECDHTPFIEFNKLKEHVRKVHELFFCEICTENLNIFSSERRCYSRSQLATHRRIGDPDDKSHKGHPRCEYCELRFLDKDELFRHLRREHYFCHLCDADGNNLFYGAINEMRDHFKSEHFLCEEDECADEQFTAVFRTEIDLRAHVATTHLKNMSRSEVKQARTIDLEFSYGPRGRSGNSHEAGGRTHDRGRIRTNDTQREFDRIPEQTILQQAPIQIDSKNEEQFPSLSGPSGGGPSVQLANTVRHITYGTSGLARTKENFPALGGTLANEKPLSQSTTTARGKQFKMPSASSMLKGPGLGVSTSKSLTNINNRPSSSTSSSAGLKKTSSDFPALSQSVNTKKNKNKADLLEDMVLPVSNVNMNLVSSKHRGLVEDNYVSMASRVSKVQTVQRKDIQTVPDPIVKKNVPKLSSADNFPTLGNGAETSNASAPQWLTVKNNQKHHNAQQETKKGKKVHEMPTKTVEKPQIPEKTSKPDPSVKAAAKHRNRVKEGSEGKKLNNGIEKEKQKQSSNKENLLAEKNFPSLGNDVTPPGFESNPQSTKKPPPGFSHISSVSEQQSISILEFTNSVQDKLKKDSSPVEHIYLAPQNATKRNQALVSEFQKTLQTPESMQEFRHVSQMFRDGNYFAKSYYETCKFVLGSGFETIFPELLALLPDIQKQQSLYAVHLEELKEAESSGAKPKKKNKSKDLEVCATCQQVLLSSDLLSHVQSHTLENNFPVLSGGVKETSSVKQWKK